MTPRDARAATPDHQDAKFCDIPADETGEIFFPGIARWVTCVTGVSVTADKLLDFLVVMFTSDAANFYGVVESAGQG